ncbi:hypothetical protein PIB30_049933 [Stylosanthes scabra]|uniref:Uncharacterized protein n=1 Tax=Stylosanthes scabra TaxID=79078 RepID=A0ABU6RHS6_9FABA|nr:hypothetical protein [Stylosanthes scabra]
MSRNDSEFHILLSQFSDLVFHRLHAVSQLLSDAEFNRANPSERSRGWGSALLPVVAGSAQPMLVNHAWDPSATRVSRVGMRPSVLDALRIHVRIVNSGIVIGRGIEVVDPDAVHRQNDRCKLYLFRLGSPSWAGYVVVSPHRRRQRTECTFEGFWDSRSMCQDRRLEVYVKR